jgi:hypothetical protein
MPVCELFLISLKANVSISQLLAALKAHSIVPLVQSRVVRWIILPTTTSTVPLLAKNHHWDLLLILQPGQSDLPVSAESLIEASWTCSCGIPSRLTNSFKEKNQELLHPAPGTISSARVPTPNSDSTQPLGLTTELASWISSLPPSERSHPISMLNLLSFHPSESAREAYKRYGSEFASKIGSRHGGDAKLVGHVVGRDGKSNGWDEVALAHYPSLEHFAAMIGSADYQAVNQAERLGALKDTFILCTMEIDSDGHLIGTRQKISKI